MFDGKINWRYECLYPFGLSLTFMEKKCNQKCVTTSTQVFTIECFRDSRVICIEMSKRANGRVLPSQTTTNFKIYGAL